MKRILFDQNVPRKLARHIAHHKVEFSYDKGWSTLANGDLIAVAEAASFEILITADQNLVHQQNLETRRLAIIVLDSNRWAVIIKQVEKIQDAINAAANGSYQLVRVFSG